MLSCKVCVDLPRKNPGAPQFLEKKQKYNTYTFQSISS